MTLPPRPPKPKRAPVSENLLGEMCTHVFIKGRRWRGYLMCTQPYCAALCNMDGSALTKEDRIALNRQLKKEQEETGT